MNRKRLLPLLSLLLALLILTGCGGGNAATFQLEEGLDLDLTKLSSTMVYSEVYNMRYEPEGYYGMRVRIAGLFSAYQNPFT